MYKSLKQPLLSAGKGVSWYQVNENKVLAPNMEKKVFEIFVIS